MDWHDAGIRNWVAAKVSLDQPGSPRGSKDEDLPKGEPVTLFRSLRDGPRAVDQLLLAPRYRGIACTQPPLLLILSPEHGSIVLGSPPLVAVMWRSVSTVSLVHLCTVHVHLISRDCCHWDKPAWRAWVALYIPCQDLLTRCFWYGRK